MNKEKEVSLIWVAKKKKKKSSSLWFGLLKTNNSARRKRKRKKNMKEGEENEGKKRRRRSLFSLVYNILIFEFALHMNNEANDRERKKTEERRIWKKKK